MKVLTNLLKELSLNGFKLKKKRTGNAYIIDDLHLLSSKQGSASVITSGFRFETVRVKGKIMILKKDIM